MVKLWAQIRYRAKAILTAAGVAAVGIAEYVIESPDTTAVIRSTVPAPYDQLLVLAVAGLAVTLVHWVPMGPKPAIDSSGDAAEPLPLAPQAPAPGQDAAVGAPAASPWMSPAPAEPGTATSLVTLTPFPARVTGGN